jgi:hypothetical protein
MSRTRRSGAVPTRWIASTSSPTRSASAVTNHVRFSPQRRQRHHGGESLVARAGPSSFSPNPSDVDEKPAGQTVSPSPTGSDSGSFDEDTYIARGKVIILAFVTCFTWAGFWLVTRTGNDRLRSTISGEQSPESNATSWRLVIAFALVLLFAYLAFACVRLARSPAIHPAYVAGYAIATISAVLVGFTFEYYAVGGTDNWSQGLDHVDAIYVAVGTLTTAGTGGINAKSDAAHLIQIGQMVADIVVITIMGALVLHRFTQPPSASPQSSRDGGTAPPARRATKQTSN